LLLEAQVHKCNWENFAPSFLHRLAHYDDLTPNNNHYVSQQISQMWILFARPHSEGGPVQYKLPL
jgi:hypothetical protein